MQVFLAHSFTGNGDIVLSAEESRHCVKVLRHKVGDRIDVIDGVGNFYMAEILEADPGKCLARVLGSRKIGGTKPYYLHIAISPTKNPDRIEWLIEKGTELGVDEFSFVICRRTEKTGARIDRFRKIAESAVKQSLQGVIPRIHERITFLDFILREKESKERKFIAHCLPGKKTLLKSVLAEKKLLVMIGPEGDFTDEEISLAQMNGFEPLGLGATRLRTETAGLLVAATLKGIY